MSRFLIATLIAALPLTVPALAQNNEKIERGKYLVKEVGKCGDCHTPRTENGERDMTKKMKGAILNVAPITPIKGWHKDAPDLTPSGKPWQRWSREGWSIS